MSGPPTQTTRSRRAQIRAQRARRVSDVPKVRCPYCGSSLSIVYASKESGVRSLDDGFRRRRQCAECVDKDGRPRTWPTIEHTDWPRFAREVEATGLDPRDFGITIVNDR